MRSIPEFLLIAVVVTLTPGPGTAAILRTAAKDGRAAAQGTIIGNSVGVLMWGVLSAVGVSALILASQLAYDALRITGAVVLVVLGLRSLLARQRGEVDAGATDVANHPERPVRRLRAAVAGGRVGLVTSVCNPKLAVFFIALFPQFLRRGAAVLPAAITMALVIVALDVAWFSGLIYLVHRVRMLVRPRVQRGLERLTGGVLVALGVRLAVEAR